MKIKKSFHGKKNLKMVSILVNMCKLSDKMLLNEVEYVSEGEKDNTMINETIHVYNKLTC